MGTIISPDDRFEWDEKKNAINKRDHGFFFEEILAVFDDPLAESPEKERYDENYQKQIAGYE
jgi:uncharacterized DUF497 family protein